MKLNRREKILVFVLLYFIILAGGFQFLLKPAITTYMENKAALAELKAKKNEIDMLVGQETLYEKQIVKSIENIEKEIEYYPSSIDMEKTHSLLSELGKDYSLSLVNINVPDYENVIEITPNAEVPATQLKKSTIDIEFEGTYLGIAKYIDKIDAFNKAMRIAELKIEPARGANLLAAKFKIDIYTVPRPDTEGLYDYVFPNAPGIMRDSGGF